MHAHRTAYNLLSCVFTAKKVDEGDKWKIGQVEDKIPTTGQGQTGHERDEREPDGPDVKTSSPLNSTDQGLLSWL